jgi:hypothetical protein
MSKRVKKPISQTDRAINARHKKFDRWWYPYKEEDKPLTKTIQSNE